MIRTGDTIPAFKLLNQDKEPVAMPQPDNPANVVIYFYPKDDTPGCTAEACSFRDQYEDFVQAGAQVIGISADDPDTHKSFAEKYQLPFHLLSDTGDQVRKRFGVPSGLFGLIPGRVTYVCDRTGVVKYIFNSQFNSTKHVSEALRILRKLNAPSNAPTKTEAISI